MPPTETSRGRCHEDGFTLIEILVAIALFAVLVLVVLTPMTGLFGLTRQSQRQIDLTGSAQATLEDVRGQWQNWKKYDDGCVSGSAPSIPAGVTVTVSTQPLTAQGGSGGSASSLTRSASCTGSTASAPSVRTSPALRRITVTATAQGQTSTLTTEVAQ